MIKYECDMCKKEIGQREGFFMFSLPFPEDKIPFSRQFHELTICPICAMKISEFIQRQALAMQGNGDGR